MKKFFGVLLALTFFTLPLVALADVSGTPPGSTVSGSPAPSYSAQQTTTSGTPYSVQNPLGPNVTSFCSVIKLLLNGALQIGIPIAVLFIVYAGFLFVLARGNSEKLNEAKSNMLWTVVGIGIFLGAWLLAQLIANTINNLQAGSNNPSSISCT